MRYVRRFPDGTLYIQEFMTKGKIMEFRSMWKQVVGGSMVLLLSAVSTSEDEDIAE